MTNNKSTKRALITSIFATFMCIAMLVGMTFAWFTDTASTGVNKIQAGNLKMEVSYRNTSNGEFKVLDKNTNVFMENALWEPGHVEFTVLNVKNTGTLALKYKLGINIASETGSTNVNDKKFKLSDYIKFAVIDGDQSTLNRDALVAKATDSKLIKEGFSKENKLNKTNDADTVTLVVWMPESVGNDANYKVGATAPEINLGINVVATQYTYESDSFNDQYDANAQYPSTVTVSAIKAKYGVDGLKMPEGVVIEKAEITVPGTQPWIITLNDEEAFLYFTQVFDRMAALGRCGSTTEYKPNDGQKEEHLRWWCGNAVTLKMGCDIDLHGETVNPFSYGLGISFDGQGHTIKNAKLSAASGGVGFFASGVTTSDVVFDNIQVSATGCESAGVVSGSTYANITNVTVKDCSVTGAKYTGAVAGYSYGDVTNCVVENTAVSGQYKVGGIVGYICCQDRTTATDETTTDPKNVSNNKLINVAVKGENLVSGKTDFVIGKIVGNWNSLNGTCRGNTFSGTTTATKNIGKIESGCNAQQ